MQLRRTESNMKQRRDDLERRDPPAPQARKHIHHDRRFEQGPQKSKQTRNAEQPLQEPMTGRIDAVQDDRQVRQALADNVKGAPNGTEDEFDIGIPFVPVVEADANGRLTDDDGPDVMEGTHGRDADAVEEFKDVGRDEDLGAHHQDVAHGHPRAARKRRVQGCVSKGHVDKGVRGDDEDEHLGAAGDVVVDEAALVEFGEVVVDGSVIFGEQASFEDVVSKSEESDEGDGEYEGREGGQGGDAGDFHP